MLSDNLPLVIKFGEIVTPLTPTTIDDDILLIIKGAEQSPKFLAAIDSVYAKWRGTADSMPATALPLVDVTAHPELADAFNESPAMQECANAIVLRRRPKDVPANAEAIGLGTIITIASQLPTLFKLAKLAAEFAKAWKEGTIGTVK